MGLLCGSQIPVGLRLYRHSRSEVQSAYASDRNLLRFQSAGQYPEHLQFTLLTPKLFKEHRKARLYGYKMADYQDPRAVLLDKDECKFARRTTRGYCCPGLAKPRWVTFEEVLEQAGLGADLDVVERPNELQHVKIEIEMRIRSMCEAGVAGSIAAGSMES